MLTEQIIKPNIVQLQLGILNTNVYVLNQGNECIVIDCPYDSGELLNYIQSHGYQLVAVVLTHGHFDHCGGVSTLLEHYNVPVYCHQGDWELCSGASSNRWRVKCDSCVPTDIIVEGRLSIGDFAFDIIHTPGHTMGGVCIIYQDILFCGDTLFAGTIGRTDINGDYDMLMASLGKLQSITNDYIVCCGHGENTSLSIEKSTNPYMVNI